MTTSSIESFEEAARLDPGALRRLLDSPRPEQRVWAIWALALRDQDVVGLAQRTAIEHDPGVRRTLAVILASHGETDLLVALARHDPAIAVRASAMQLVTRLAAAGAIDRSVIHDAERREPEIQMAILAAIDAGAPEFLVALAGRLLDGDDDPVQVEAFEALVRVASPPTLERAIAWLASTDMELVADACQRWHRLADAQTIAAAVAPLPWLVRTITLRVLRAPSWAIVEQLAPDLPSLRVESAQRPDVIAPPAVLRRLLIDAPGAQAVTAVERQLARFDAPASEPPPELGELLAHCRHRSEQLRTEIAELQRDMTVALAPADRSRTRAYLTSPDFHKRNDRLAESRALAALTEQLDRLVQRGR